MIRICVYTYLFIERRAAGQRVAHDFRLSRSRQYHQAAAAHRSVPPEASFNSSSLFAVSLLVDLALVILLSSSPRAKTCPVKVVARHFFVIKFALFQRVFFHFSLSLSLSCIKIRILFSFVARRKLRSARVAREVGWNVDKMPVHFAACLWSTCFRN